MPKWLLRPLNPEISIYADQEKDVNQGYLLVFLFLSQEHCEFCDQKYFSEKIIRNMRVIHNQLRLKHSRNREYL